MEYWEPLTGEGEASAELGTALRYTWGCRSSREVSRRTPEKALRAGGWFLFEL